MADKMLIDATHPEETRVVVLRGNRVEEFDFESANRKQLRGNIYLAKVTRVEPSLQAAFVDYGGNRHGFLAFSEIHPDYYQIPVADRQALIAQEERDQREAEAEADNRARHGRRPRYRNASRHRRRDVVQSEPLPTEGAAADFGESRRVKLVLASRRRSRRPKMPRRLHNPNRLDPNSRPTSSRTMTPILMPATIRPSRQRRQTPAKPRSKRRPKASSPPPLRKVH